MKKNHKIRKHKKWIMFSLLGVMVTPLIADGIFSGGRLKNEIQSAVLDYSNMESRTIGKNAAITDRVRIRKQTREFWQAMKIYQNRVRDGAKDLVPPDMNDYQSILDYLRGTRPQVQPKESEEHSSAPADEQAVSSLQIEDLGENERHLLRRYQKSMSCPETLKDYGLQGFYELCLSVTKNPAGTPRIGLLNPRQWINREKEVKPASLKLRLEMVEQALDRSNRRESTEPGRPEPYIK